MAGYKRYKRTVKAKKAYTTRRIKKVVMSIAERKYKTFAWNTVAAPNSMAASWFFQSFFVGSALNGGIIQGTDANTRLGNKIYVEGIRYRFVAKGQGTVDATGGSNCRFAIYHNKQCNGVATSGAEVMTTNTVVATRNPDYVRKIAVKRDLTMSMTATSGTTVGPAWPIIGYCKVNKVIDMVTNTGTITQLIKDDFGFGFIADVAACCEIYGEYTILFRDA